MPGGAGKAKRSCPMCKPNKFAGNNPEKRSHKENARAPGSTRSERSRAAREMAED